MLGSDYTVDAFHSFTLAILLLFAGKAVTQRVEPLRRYSIPEPVVGGLLCASVVSLLYLGMGLRVNFELEARDMLLLYFFAGIGLKSDVRTLRTGGRPLLVLLVLASVFIVLQNAVGMSLAALFGQDPRAGLMLGSIPLTGGFGTTLAWAPHFVSELGITNALELGTAANMVGLVAACVIGGPMAKLLMRTHGIAPSLDPQLDVGAAHHAQAPPVDYHGLLLAWLWLNLALLLGQAIGALARGTGLMLPDFVGCLLAGIVLRNVAMPLLPGLIRVRWRQLKGGLALISDLSLGMFLTMALMGLQLWVLQGAVTFILTVLCVQIALTLAYTRWVVFRAMGRDYEAVVVCAGFGGIALGSTSTAVANMNAVTQQHGAAHRAFIVVPLVCGFFVDLVNALVIGVLAR